MSRSPEEAAMSSARRMFAAAVAVLLISGSAWSGAASRPGAEGRAYTSLLLAASLAVGVTVTRFVADRVDCPRSSWPAACRTGTGVTIELLPVGFLGGAVMAIPLGIILGLAVDTLLGSRTTPASGSGQLEAVVTGVRRHEPDVVGDGDRSERSRGHRIA